LAGGTKGFRVEPDQLLQVADQVHRLLEDLSGGSGYVAGNMPRYQQQADKGQLTSALQSFWNGEDVFATAYGYEHDGVVQTMNAMVTQLTNLENACRATAQKYGGEDKATKQTVQNSGPAGPGPGRAHPSPF
jgi:uncharacterized protein YukE